MIYLILALAALLRLVNLNSLPIALFGDEIDVGYHAWSLITTGKDYLGNSLPTFIQSLAEWRTPLLSYVIAPFVGLFGPTIIRLPVALLGVLNIYLIYLLTNQLFQKKTQIGVLAAFILTISPWHIHYSRIAIDSTLLLSLLCAGTYFFLKGLKASKFFFPAIISFVLTFYTYPTANLFTPLLVLSLLVIYRRNKDLVKQLVKRSYLLILLLPIAYHLTLGQAAGRFKGISVFSDKEIVYDIVNQRTSPWVDQNAWQEKIFHNKAVSYLGEIGSNYLSAFSPQFLFISGDPNFRHSVSRFGELLWIMAPFLLLGVVYLLNNLKNKGHQLLLIWTLIAPIPSALTSDGAMHATRLILLLPPLIIISALGVKQSLVWVKNHKKFLFLPFAVLLLALTTANVAAYWHRYSSHYKFESFRHWHYGYPELFIKAKPYLEKANKVYINNTYEPSLLRFAFFAGIPPQEFQESFKGDAPENLEEGITGFRLGEKYVFTEVIDIGKIKRLLKPNDLYFAVQGKEVPGDWDWSKEPPQGLKVLESVKNVYGDPLFYLLTKE